MNNLNVKMDTVREQYPRASMKAGYDEWAKRYEKLDGADLYRDTVLSGRMIKTDTSTGKTLFSVARYDDATFASKYGFDQKKVTDAMSDFKKLQAERQKSLVDCTFRPEQGGNSKVDKLSKTMALSRLGYRYTVEEGNNSDDWTIRVVGGKYSK